MKLFRPISQLARGLSRGATSHLESLGASVPFYRSVTNQAARRDDTMGRVLAEQLQAIKEGGTYKVERVITSEQAANIQVASQEGVRKEVLNFCANNYLGLSSEPKVVAAAHKALDTHGYGLSSVRFICGTQDIHKEVLPQIRNPKPRNPKL
eukprot:910758-Prorocentrum_minimum.AAC.9